jgi:hypothetical protein
MGMLFKQYLSLIFTSIYFIYTPTFGFINLLSLKASLL